jgi:hypothetical protein
LQQSGAFELGADQSCGDEIVEDDLLIGAIIGTVCTFICVCVSCLFVLVLGEEEGYLEPRRVLLYSQSPSRSVLQ